MDKIRSTPFQMILEFESLILKFQGLSYKGLEFEGLGPKGLDPIGLEFKSLVLNSFVSDPSPNLEGSGLEMFLGFNFLGL